MIFQTIPTIIQNTHQHNKCNVIMAASVHPNLACKKENVIGIQLLNQNKHYMNIEVSKQGEKGKIKRTNKKNIQPL